MTAPLMNTTYEKQQSKTRTEMIIKKIPANSSNINSFKTKLSYILIDKFVNMEKQSKQTQLKVEKDHGQHFQIIWRNILIVMVAIFVYCIPGFLSFKNMALAHGLYFIPNFAWIWTAVGFVVYGTVKYIYFRLVYNKAYEVVNPKYHKEGERQYRAKAIQKLSFDFFFYLTSALTAFIWFHNEEWFPTQLGGEGKCSNIFREYPNWPSGASRSKLELFYTLQLGKYLFSIFESIFIRGKSYRKFYEFLLHHFISAVLILASLLSNMVAVGAVILFLHDTTDMTMDIARVWVQTKYRKTVIDVFLFLLGAISWFYMRVFVYPSCAIWALYESLPTPNSLTSGLYFQHISLIILCSMLVVMHCYWLFYLMKIGINMSKGKGTFNSHDKGKIKI